TAPPPAGPSHVRTLEAAQPTRVEMPAATLLGNVQTLKGGFDQSGNLIPGTTDASAAAVYKTQAGDKFLFVAGDEDQSIRMYKFEAPTQEYKLVKSWDFSNELGLTDTARGPV